MSDLLVIGNYGGPVNPRDVDSEVNPLPGQSWKFFQEAAHEAGLDLDQAMLVAAYPHPRVTQDPFTTEELKIARENLATILSHIKTPRVILVLGNDAMRAVLRKSGLGEKRGEEVEVQINGETVKVLPTYHPTNVINRPRNRPVWIKDLVRARQLLYNEPMLDPTTGMVLVERVTEDEL